jgi:hypothetical protein
LKKISKKDLGIQQLPMEAKFGVYTAYIYYKIAKTKKYALRNKIY